MAHIEIVQVAAYLFGRIDDTVYIQVAAVKERREHFRQHCFLDCLRHLQFPFHALVLLREV